MLECKNLGLNLSDEDNEISYIYDKLNGRDIIMARCDKNISLWNMSNFKLISYLNDEVLEKGFGTQCCFLVFSDEIFIIVIHHESIYDDVIIIFDLEGKIKNRIFFQNKENGYLLKTFYDKKTNKAFIIIGYENYIRVSYTIS